MFCSHIRYAHCVTNYIFTAFAFCHRSRFSYASIFTCGFEPIGNIVNDILSPGEGKFNFLRGVINKSAESRKNERLRFPNLFFYNQKNLGRLTVYQQGGKVDSRAEMLLRFPADKRVPDTENIAKICSFITSYMVIKTDYRG